MQAMSRLFAWLVVSTWVALWSPSIVQAWYIAPPVSPSDWQQLAQVLARQQSPPSDQNWLAPWDWWNRRQTQAAIYRRYVNTARNLKASKYLVLLAKDEFGPVCAVAEMGISNAGRPTLGVLCVEPTARRRGIGASLVHRCEDVAANIWKEDSLFVEVETSNRQAQKFFEACGYVDTKERSMVTVQTGKNMQNKPHIVLVKHLPCRNIADNELQSTGS